MQERRNKRLVISFGILTVALVIVLVFTTNDSAFDVDKNYYKTADLKEVDKIVLQSNDGVVELSFQGNRWRVNNTYPADRQLIEVLFATLQQAEPKRPVASSQRDSVAAHLRKHGVNVSLFSQNENVESFYAGGNTAKSQAYFLKKDGDIPHQVIIPGYRVYVAGIFELPPHQWRDKLVFDFNWRNFKNLDVRFRNPAGNFEVVMEKNSVEIKGLTQVDTARLDTFLDQLLLLTVEEYVETDQKLEDLAKEEPLAFFQIKDIGNRIYFLKVYAEERQLVGLIHGEQFAILPEDRIKALLRPKEYFVKR